MAAAVTLPPWLPYPHRFCVLYCRHQIVYGISIFYFRFLAVETNPGPRHPVPTVCRLLSNNVRGLVRYLSDLTVASFRYDILLWSETLFSDMCYVSELLIPWFGRPVLLCRGRMPRARGMAAYVLDGYGALRQPKFVCGCCEMFFFRVCGARQNLCVQSLPGLRTDGVLLIALSQPCITNLF